MKKLSVILITILLLLTFAIGVFALPQDKYVYDRVGIFTDSEISELEAYAEAVYEKIKCQIYIVSDNTQNVTYWGDDFTREYGISGNSIILIITANSRNNYNLYTYGNAYSKISNSEVNKILDHKDVYNNIKSGKYFEGAKAFITESADAYKPNVGAIVAIALIFASLSSIIFAVCVYNNYNKKLRSVQYPLDRYAKLELREKSDNFAGTFVTKRRIQTSSSRGRSGGSRGGGGGGGHRGGR